MQRRTIVIGGAAALATARAFAAPENDADAASGIRAALERGAVAAVGILGKPDGFLGNPKVKIELPGFLKSAGKILKVTGQKQRVDDLVTAMNRAAEAAVPEAKAMLVAAVKAISVADARKVVSGPSDSVTKFFADKTRSPLAEKFLPIVTKETEKVDLASRYNAVAEKASATGLLKGDAANIERYVTGKALDGLYFMIGEEEKKIRKDPIGTGSALLARVFGR